MQNYGYDRGYQNGYEAAIAEMEQTGYDDDDIYEDEYEVYAEPVYYAPRPRPQTISYAPARQYAPAHQMVEDDDAPVHVSKSMHQSIAVGAIALVLMFLIIPLVNGARERMYPSSTTSAVMTPAPQQEQASSQGDLSVVGQPSISEAKIAEILASYGSPLSAQTIYSYGVQYNIDPAFPLAFFIHESGCGTAGAAVAHKNPGNLRSSPLEVSQDGFAYFQDWNTGIHAWFELIASTMYVRGGLTTVSAIVEKYAPSADANDPAGYTQAVISSVNGWRA